MGSNVIRVVAMIEVIEKKLLRSWLGGNTYRLS